MSERRDVLPYKSSKTKPPAGRNPLAVVAFVASIVFSPYLRLAVKPRLFWTGQPLYWVREIVEAVPVFALPLPGIVLGICALVAANRFNLRRGLALAAIFIGVSHYLCLGAFLGFLFFILFASN